MSLVGNTVVKQAHKGTSSGYFCKKITQTVYPRNAEDFSTGIELTIEIIGDKIQMGAKKDGKYFEGLEPFLNEGDIVNLVNQKPEMKEDIDEGHNLCLFFRYEGFPPIKLIQQIRKPAESSIKENASKIQDSPSKMPAEHSISMAPEKLKEYIKQAYNKEIKQRQAYYQQRAQDTIYDQNKIDSKLKESKDIEVANTVIARQELMDLEIKRIHFYQDSLNDWKELKGKLNQVQYLIMINSFTSTNYKEAVYLYQRKSLDKYLIKLLEDLRKSKQRKGKEYEETEQRLKSLGQEYRELETCNYFIEKETILQDTFLKVDETQSYNQKNIELVREISIQENAANQFQEKLFEKQKELNDIRMENHKLEKKVKEFEEQLRLSSKSAQQQKILKDEIDQQNEKYIKLSIQYEQIKKNYESRLIDLESYIMVKEREIKVLKHQLNQKTLTLEKLENVTETDCQNHRFLVLKTQHDDLKEKNEKLKRISQEQDQDLNNKEQQLSKSQVYLELAQKELERYKQQDQSLNEQQVHYLVIRNEYEVQKKEMVKQIQKIQKYQETRRHQENQINQLEQQVMEQNKELLRQKNDLDAQKIEIEKKIIENSNLRLKIQMRNQ